MTFNSSNAAYSSQWDIDQLYTSNEVDGISLAGNQSTPAFITLTSLSGFSYPPVIDGTWQISGDSVWRQFGDITYSSFWVNCVPQLAITSTGLSLYYFNYNSGGATINVRYYIWTDKVTN